MNSGPENCEGDTYKVLLRISVFPKHINTSEKDVEVIEKLLVIDTESEILTVRSCETCEKCSRRHNDIMIPYYLHILKNSEKGNFRKIRTGEDLVFSISC